MCGIFFCLPSHGQEAQKPPVFKVEKAKYRFGFVRQGKVVKIEYEFHNAGEAPLILSELEVTCGCTVAEFPRHPIRKGESGLILVTFNTKEKIGRQDRFVKVISNASNSPYELRFKGVVLEEKGK